VNEWEEGKQSNNSSPPPRSLDSSSSYLFLSVPVHNSTTLNDLDPLSIHVLTLYALQAHRIAHPQAPAFDPSLPSDSLADQTLSWIFHLTKAKQFPLHMTWLLWIASEPPLLSRRDSLNLPSLRRL
jgi:hypothetical protein